MASMIDNLDITGMKKSDFIQLEEMFNYVLNEDIRWDRSDYWNARNERLKTWFEYVLEIMYDNDIKIKG